LRGQNWPWLTEVKKLGIIDTIGKGEDVLQKRNPLSKLRQNIKLWNDNPPATTNKERQRKKDINKAITALYDTIEHTFAALLLEFPSDEWTKNYEKGNFGDNKRLLIDCAQKIGFYIDEKNTNLLEAVPGKIRAVREGIAELEPLLALAITVARYDRAHPCNTLASEFPDFLTFAHSLRALRNPIKHGDTSVEIPVEDLENLLVKTEKALYLINGESTVPKNTNDTTEDMKTDYDRQRLRATTMLEKLFGIPVLQCMDKNMKELLYSIEMPSNDTQWIVNNMAALLQRLFYLMLLEQNILAMPDSEKDIKLSIRQRALSMGLLQADKDLPPSIWNVNDRRLKDSMQGLNTTLQANFAALIAAGAEELLRGITESTPQIVEIVNKIAETRGHGNREITISKDALDDMKNNVFATTKNLLEVFEKWRNR
jgi:hypothetical protein